MSTDLRQIDGIDERQHQQSLEAAVKQHKWRLTQDVTMRLLDGSSLYYITRKDRDYSNFVFSEDWEYVEVRFETTGSTGLNRLRKRPVGYAVMRLQLPRKLPNIIFDSLEHQRRQFRVYFDSKQHIELEGNFNNYFATYFGTGYTIDDLSFITPEVMEALIVAKDYDIEIVHNSMLLFGQIKSDAQTQLSEMDQAIRLINDKLLNNILTYRDERVLYDQGRLIVARAGMFLSRGQMGGFSLFIYVFSFLTCVAVGIVFLSIAVSLLDSVL